MTGVRVGRRTIELSKPDKVLFPGAGITKRDLFDHYRAVAGDMLPHLRRRPLTLQRFPDGIGKGGFYQKQAADHFPDWVRTVKVKKAGGSLTMVVCDDTATLAYLADQACVTLHPWLSRADRPRKPDRLVFDLDPSTDDFAAVVKAARLLRDLLDELGLKPFAQTTGSRGLHVVVPLARRDDFDATRAFARGVAELLADRHPESLTVEQRKDKRGDRIYLDVQRNAYAQTAVAPYTVRARPGAPVATPVGWHEVGKGLRPDRWTLRNIGRRLGQTECPWRGMGRHGRSLAEPRKLLQRMR